MAYGFNNDKSKISVQESLTAGPNIEIDSNNTITAKVLIIDIPSFSSLPQTITNTDITEDMVVINSELGTPSAQTSDWAVNTSRGSLSIAGSISGSTTLKLFLINS